MIIGANLLVNGSVSIAERFNIPEFVIGALIVGIGTSLPELVVSLTATINNLNDVAIGNVIGSNIFNILGILGITSLLCPIVVNKNSIKFDIPICGIISVLIFLMSFNFYIDNSFGISRIDGFLLLLFFFTYIILSFNKSDKYNLSNNISIKESLCKIIFKIIIGLLLLIFNCELFIDSSVELARNLNISESFISLTIISCGTSMPELVSSVMAAIKKKSDIALGNIIGSNIFNISFILGVCSIFKPLINSNITIIDYSVMIFSILIISLIGLFGKINRVFGGIMLTLFVIYTTYLIYIQ